LQHLCRTFTVLAEIFAEVVAGFIRVTVRVVKSWLALKRLLKKRAFLPPPFHAHFAAFTM
jgi:hypothetical protein